MFKSLRNPLKKQIQFLPALERAKDFPPLPMKQHLPSWYKQMGSYVHGGPDAARWRNVMDSGNPFTVKRCVPVQDYLTSGYMIRNCVDVMISRNTATDPEDVQWFLPSNFEMHRVFGTHTHGQCPVKMQGKDRHYIKLMSPWIIKTPPGYSCLFYQNFYLQEERFALFPAIVDTDTYDHAIGFPGYVTDAEMDFRIEAGTPLMSVFPFKRDEWQAQIGSDLVLSEDSKASMHFKQYFENVYRNLFHSKKRYD